MTMMRTPDEVSMLQKIWVILLDEGVLIDDTAEWSYYASAFDGKYMYDYDLREKDKVQVLKGVKNVGVDWDRTDAPEFYEYSGFVDTFSDSSRHAVWDGRIVLKDGSVYRFAVIDEDTIGTYVHQFRTYAHVADRARTLFG